MQVTRKENVFYAQKMEIPFKVYDTDMLVSEGEPDDYLITDSNDYSWLEKKADFEANYVEIKTT